MDRFPKIIIPEKNDFIYALTIPDILLESVENLHVFVSTTPLKTIEACYTINGNVLKIPFRDLDRGAYNLWVTFTKDGQRISYNYNEAFRIVAWNNQYINWEQYKEGSELAVEAGVALVVDFACEDFQYLWNTLNAIEGAKEDAEVAAKEAHEAAEYARQEGDKAKEISQKILHDADEAIAKANEATAKADKAVEEANSAVEEAHQATTEARGAADRVDEVLDKIVQQKTIEEQAEWGGQLIVNADELVSGGVSSFVHPYAGQPSSSYAPVSKIYSLREGDPIVYSAIGGVSSILKLNYLSSGSINNAEVVGKIYGAGNISYTCVENGDYAVCSIYDYLHGTITAIQDVDIVDEAIKATDAANTAAIFADSARRQLTDTFNEKVAALDADYAQKKQALDTDYANVKQSLGADYANTKAALDSEYTAKKAALEADYKSVKDALYASYSEALNSLNSRMSAIESQYMTDKASWQREVDAMLAKFEQDFATAEADREARVAAAIASANTAATHAGNVNAELTGTMLTITNRDGQSRSVDTKGEKGDKGDSITMFPNVTIFGQPIIQESQISGFTAQNYVQFPFVVDFAGRYWQLDCSITTGADVAQQHNVFDSNFGLAFAFSGGKFVLAMSSNGTSWNLGANAGTHTILANTTYYIRISWDGATYKLAYSTNKETWVDDIVVASAESLYPRQIVIGKDLANLHIFNGSINMSDAHLSISGKIVWEGMDDAGLATRMAIDLSNIDAEGKQKLNEVAMAGAVGEKIGELEEDKFSIGGYDESARVGSANVLQPTAKSTTVEYEEKLPASRCVAYSPDNGSVGDAVNPMGQFAPVIREVAGVSSVGCQVINFAKYPSSVSKNGLTLTSINDTITLNGTSTKDTYFDLVTFRFKTDKYMLLGCPSGGGSSKTYTLYYGGVRDAIDEGSGSVFRGTDTLGQMYVRVWKEGIVCNNLVFRPILLDLTILHQLPTTFVNSLSNSDANKVLHRLAFTSIDINGETITENINRLLKNGAEDIALVGYKEPQFDLTMVGKLVVIDSTKPCNTRNGVPATISHEIDFRTTLRNAWAKLLDVLRERGIAIPDVALQPINLASSDDVRNVLTSHAFEVNCWIKEGTEAAEGEIALGGYVIYPLAEPITIDLDQTINFSTGDCNGMDVIGLCDMDGNPMYDAEIEVDSNSKPTKIDLRWNKEWVEANKKFPASVGTFLQGMKLKVDYDTIAYLWEKVQELLNK